MIWFLLFWACAAQVARTGLVMPTGAAVSLTTPEGQATRLLLEGDAQAISRLQGCVIDVVGTRTAGGLRVSSWTVRDAGFGSQPFVGRMRQTLSGWVLDDRTTGSVLRIPDVGVGEPLEGSLVLINGLVVGEHVLQLISVRTLLEPSEDVSHSP